MTDENEIIKIFLPSDSNKVVNNINKIKQPLFNIAQPLYILNKNNNSDSDHLLKAYVPPLLPENLGDNNFKKRHNLKYAYIAGAMANGISSVQMVQAMANNGMTGFFGAGGLSLDKIENAILELKETLDSKTFGFNLIHSPNDPDHEMAVAKLYLKHNINLVSAAAFMRITLPLVYYRIKGLCQDLEGKVVAPNKIIAKVSRVEVAREFFSPPPEKLVNQLLTMGLITNKEAELSKNIPMAQDITAEADSGGHTDNRPALALLPTMLSLKNRFSNKFNYSDKLCVGLAGGIATPESAAAAFQMGAGYILTGSINQSCIEANISLQAKKMLVQAQQADMAMAPAADMFEIGARVQVLKRGTMFAIRAEKLYNIYKNYQSFDKVPAKDRKQIEEKFLMASFDEKWLETKEFFENCNNIKEIQRAEDNPKHKMALVFRSYLGLSSKWAIAGDEKRSIDYQIWCGPAIGAFNQWVNGTFLESHENRQVVIIALNLLFGASVCIRRSWLENQNIGLPSDVLSFPPVPVNELMKMIS
ncbi:MAG: PfaD family polyunsaturated fatty acid/polyketide biosynthesis protein [Desulfobacteraceae bacterium]|nr:PfaD family polyunsaturated fatty acid/polyketide biosynthesis protein [Desulfobacteraceae bacterium]